MADTHRGVPLATFFYRMKREQAQQEHNTAGTTLRSQHRPSRGLLLAVEEDPPQRPHHPDRCPRPRRKKRLVEKTRFLTTVPTRNFKFLLLVILLVGSRFFGSGKAEETEPAGGAGAEREGKKRRPGDPGAEGQGRAQRGLGAGRAENSGAEQNPGEGRVACGKSFLSACAFPGA